MKVLITQEDNRYIIAELKGKAFTLRQRVRANIYSLNLEAKKRRDLRQDRKAKAYVYQFDKTEDDTLWTMVWTGVIFWGGAICIIYTLVYM